MPWGSVNGTPVNLYTLTNGRMTVDITNYGAIVQSIWVPDHWGKMRNVALGFPRLSDYVNDFTQGFTGVAWPIPGAGGSGDTFFGATIGRYANRIANHAFTMSCTGCSNNGTHLHAGLEQRHQHAARRVPRVEHRRVVGQRDRRATAGSRSS